MISIMASAGKRERTGVPQHGRSGSGKSRPGYDKQIAFFEKTWFSGGGNGSASGPADRSSKSPSAPAATCRSTPADVSIPSIELSPAMLSVARQRAASLSREADLREGDAEQLPFGDASFDTVVCALSLCTIPSPGAAVGEMRRVLRPGGPLLLLDQHRQHLAAALRRPVAAGAHHDPPGRRALHPPPAPPGQGGQFQIEKPRSSL